MNTTTTNQPKKATSPASGRSAGSGWLWKSVVVTASLTSVLLGWATLSNDGASVEAATTTAPSIQTVIVNSNSNSNSNINSPALPPLVMPQKPIFQQPVTRTRRS